ncbi:MAG: XTP/dITP diphosphatase [Desulfobacca sp.]|uniref:XTP/dITP diphosphatase n=1 Tax=Desulfobacca sp. TaxID=2067990 RepID=UPI00404AEF63
MAAPVLVIATKNPGKIRELAELLSDLGVTLKTLADYPYCPEVVEDGATFAANATKKAVAVARYTGLPALADDSGLEVDALGGRPGVHAARYAADRTAPARPRDEDNYRKLLDELAGVPAAQRTARFVCCMVVAFPNGRTVQTQGTCEGLIHTKPEGHNGFGYDPVFWLPAYQATMAQLGLEIKNRISHRAKALAQLKTTLAALLRQEPDLFQPTHRLGT